jgi:hypothetical protein
VKRFIITTALLGMLLTLDVSGLALASSVHRGHLTVHAAASKPMAGNPWHGFIKTGPAVRSVLLRGASVCGRPTAGTGYAIFTPGVVGKMRGPHMILQVSLTGSRGSRSWGLETILRQGRIIRDDSSVGMLRVNSQGNGALVERTMPMIHPGTYTVQLLVRDPSCGSATRHPVAYKTAPARIVFKGQPSMPM